MSANIWVVYVDITNDRALLQWGTEVRWVDIPDSLVDDKASLISLWNS